MSRAARQKLILLSIFIGCMLIVYISAYMVGHFTGNRDGMITNTTLSALIRLSYFILFLLCILVLSTGKNEITQETVRQWFFSFCIGLAGLVLVEITLRAVYYQKHEKQPLAIMQQIAQIKLKAARKAAKRQVDQTVHDLGLDAAAREITPLEIQDTIHDMLYTEAGKKLLLQFQQAYEQDFIQLVEEVRKIKAILLVVYIPSHIDIDAPRITECRRFFRELALRHHIRYLDITEALFEYPVQTWTLLPENNHLSRFGNQITARLISEKIACLSDYHSPVTYQKHPKRMGDLEPSLNETWEIKPSMPYRVITNRQGFRMGYDLEFPKKKQRVLVMGDSFTFSPFLSNHDCYPNLMDKSNPDQEVINAGIMGYTITDVLSLFQERARFCEPDIVIVQVLDNDIFGFISFKKNQLDRKGVHVEPTPEETAFIGYVKKNMVP